MTLDQLLLFSALTAYIVGSLVFLMYFLNGSRLLRDAGIGLAALGCVSLFGELAARWATSGIWPLTNLYGSLSLFAALGVTIFLAFGFRYRIWFVGGFVLLIASVTLGYATTWNEGYMPPVPALQSYWIKIHVPLVIGAYASFMVAFVVAVVYLLKHAFERHSGKTHALTPAPALAALGHAAMERFDAPMNTGAVRIVGLRSDTPHLEAAAARGDPWASWLATLPSLAQLDIMSYRIVAIGLPLLTIGIITGAWWAKEAWGAYWQWDPKETAALVSWIVYASFMHLHTRNQWRGYRCALVNVLGFVTVIFCYLGVNIWVSGLHSYKL